MLDSYIGIFEGQSFVHCMYVQMCVILSGIATVLLSNSVHCVAVYTVAPKFQFCALPGFP